MKVIAHQDDIHIRKEEEGNIIIKGLGMLSIEKVGHTAIRMRQWKTNYHILNFFKFNFVLVA